MRNLVLILILTIVSGICFSQTDMRITEKRNIYNEKGDYYVDRNEYKKAIVFYNMAFRKDTTDYFSVLKKADAYTKLEMYPQAEECYRIVFESNRRPDNIYRLKYASVFLADHKPEEFKKWLGLYNQVVDAELQSKNVLVSKENRLKLYKDSTIILIANTDELTPEEETYLSAYKKWIQKDGGMTKVTVEGFNFPISHPAIGNHDTVLYFASDAPGGKGGKDIYRSHMVNGKWGTPENMDAINTSGDEMYPFVSHDSILYFTSNGHGGFGGSDLFWVNTNHTPEKAVNLGNQINTSSDDYGLFLTPGGQTGFFSSAKSGNAVIYKADILNFKMKYEAYRHRTRPSPKDNMINLIMSNGDEYYVDKASGGDYTFSFAPAENYNIIIQRENISVDDILHNTNLTPALQKREFLDPPPVQRAEIIVPQGMKYDFSAGQSGISEQYKNALKAKEQDYQNPDDNVINLTALAKELEFTDGEVYTIRFEKDKKSTNLYKSNEVTTLFVNDKTISMYGDESFFAVFPLKEEVSFNIQTDLAELEKKYNPKKYALVVDDKPVFSDEKDASGTLIPLTVNTKSENEVQPANRLSAKEISIIPGTEYLLTLSKPDSASGEDIEIIVPLTRGVKYNLNSDQEDHTKYKEALAELLTGRQGLELADEEVIDISVLSKELEVLPGEDVSFHMMPIKQFGNKPATTKESKSVLTLDGKNYELTQNEKYTINIPFTAGQKVNLQTDLDYMQEHFEPDDYTLRLDTASFFSEIVVDTTGYGYLRSTGWLVSMNVNTDSVEEVESQNHFVSREVSIVPGKEYILTVSKTDAGTGKKSEIIIPLIRHVKYDFTTKPDAEKEYMESLKNFVTGQEELETKEGTLIDITLISKELQINEGDIVFFSLLPVKDLAGKPSGKPGTRSSLYLDNKVVEFTQFQKYTINVPLSEDHQVNMQTNLEYLEYNFDPGTYTVDVDTIEFFSSIVVDTTGYGNRVINEEEEITDPVFDVVVVNFNLNEYSLTPNAKKIIQENVIDELKGDSRLYVTIKGYTDALGNADYNLRLSKNRAESVKEFLKANGIGENRIRTFSFGESQSLEEGVNWEDLNEEELKKHRKVEIVIYLPE